MQVRLEFVFAIVCLAGCSAVDESPRAVNVPDANNYRAVHQALSYSCGTLDCHGSPYRNYKIYGAIGLRLDPNHVTGDGTSTDAEIDASYRALVGLEPFKLSNVIAGRADAATLTLVRKARGTEAHVAGAPFPTGSAGDRCLSAWLAGGSDEAACAAASGR